MTLRWHQCCAVCLIRKVDPILSEVSTICADEQTLQQECFQVKCSCSWEPVHSGSYPSPKRTGQGADAVRPGQYNPGKRAPVAGSRRSEIFGAAEVLGGTAWLAATLAKGELR